MSRIIVFFGSNLEPEKHRALAREALAARFGDVRESGFLYTDPIGRSDQPRYLNGAFSFESAETAEALVSGLHAIEARLGRVRSGDKYAPRTVDLDLIALGDAIVHKDYSERDFVRRCVRELAPDLP